MEWTIEQKVEWLLRQPWRVSVEREEDGSFFARVEGLPSAVADGSGPKELQDAFWESLRATLQAYLQAGDPIPVPNQVTPPWESTYLASVHRRIRARIVNGADVTPQDPTTSLGAIALPV